MPLRITRRGRGSYNRDVIEWDVSLGEINQCKCMLNLRGFPLVPYVGNIMTSIEWYFVMDKNPVCTNWVARFLDHPKFKKRFLQLKRYCKQFGAGVESIISTKLMNLKRYPKSLAYNYMLKLPFWCLHRTLVFHHCAVGLSGCFNTRAWRYDHCKTTADASEASA